MRETQLSQVREHLIKFGCLSSWQAITEYRITRLSEYIRILRHDEFMRITDEWQGNGKTCWKLYKLENKDVRPS